MNMVEIIRIKRDGGELTDEQLRFVALGCGDGSIPDYQISAFTMAVYFNGMTKHETAVFTDAMARSGDMVDLSMFGDKTVDKHSTGGVGDKTSLVIAPVVSALGGIMAKMSGRALGHTGGTVDKLEAFHGYRTTMNKDEFIAQVKSIGIAMIGQSTSLTPADKKLYSIRDVTATVESIPLIASSIMSKKLAAGAHSIVLDVKTGSGAFMNTLEKSRQLAREMVDIGVLNGRRMTALITNMDAPLGNCIGNTLELNEAMDVLRGYGPDDLRTVCTELASEMLMLTNGWSKEESMYKVKECIDSGKALEQCKRWISAQDGDISVIEDSSKLPKANIIEPVKAESDGYIGHMDARLVGMAEALLGAGRMKKDEPIDLTAGIVLIKKTGDRVKKGETIAYLHTNDAEKFENGKRTFVSAISLTETEPVKQPLIYEIIRG